MRPEALRAIAEQLRRDADADFAARRDKAGGARRRAAHHLDRAAQELEDDAAGVTAPEPFMPPGRGGRAGEVGWGAHSSLPSVVDSNRVNETTMRESTKEVNSKSEEWARHISESKAPDPEGLSAAARAAGFSSAAHLADKVGVTKQAMTNYKKGRPAPQWVFDEVKKLTGGYELPGGVRVSRRLKRGS